MSPHRHGEPEREAALARDGHASAVLGANHVRAVGARAVAQQAVALKIAQINFFPFFLF